jgi:RNA polymerase-binding protein DksA
MIQPKSPLDRPRLRRFRSRLFEERRRLRDSLDRLYGAAVQDNPENLGDTPERTHLADLGTEAFEQSQDLGLAEQAGRMIRETDHALERLEHGTYGICESCGRPISIERLEAIPSASRCAECQSEFERGAESS